MPTPYIQKLAKQKKMPVADVEKKWDAAKAQAKKEGKASNYAYITSIFKSMMHVSSVELSKIKVTAADAMIDSAVTVIVKRIADLLGVRYSYKAKTGIGDDVGITVVTKRWGGKIIPLQQVLKNQGFTREGIATPKYACWTKTVDYGVGQPAYMVSISLLAGTPDVASIWITKVG